MTTTHPEPYVDPPTTEVDQSTTDFSRSKSTASPTPHPGEPDSRPTSAVRDPDDEQIQEGISSPKVGP